MKSLALIGAGLAALLGGTGSAWGQRADENAVRAAGDAFGTSVGNERIGLYSAGDVRGFSPITAGNIRIEGLAVTEHEGFTNRISSGSTIRVGLTAQGYPFPAPTGIADYALRSSDNEAVLSPILYVGPNRTTAFDLDAQLPLVRDRLSIAAGLAYRHQEAFIDERSKNVQGGIVLRWRPTDRIEIKPFYVDAKVTDDFDAGEIFTAGPYLPPTIGRRYFGLDWTQSEARRRFYGALGSVQLSDAWRVRAGLFRSENYAPISLNELYRNVQRDGSARRLVVAQKDQRVASTSGEVRASYAFADGARQHVIQLAARGRDTRRELGGGAVLDAGPAVIGRRTDVPEPDFVFGPRTRNQVRQVTGGIGYEGRWPRVGQLSLGLQKTDYEQTVRIPGRPLLSTKDRPWLYNAMLALQLTDRLVAYGGYTSGLEESAVAPANAVNRDLAPPALRTSQRDAGLRYSILSGLNVVVGAFDVRKPYFNIDPDRVYRQLGAVRHRGVELSLAGQPLPGLSVVGGAVFLDAQVSGEAVELGIIGGKPVGTTRRNLRINFDYRLPFFDPISIDLGIANQAGKIASPIEYAELNGRQLMTEPRTTLDIGGRYRFKVRDAPVTLRAQAANIFNTDVWDVGSNSSFKFIEARRFLVTLAADL